MNSILYFQAAKLQDKDVIVSDGRIIEDIAERNECIHEIFEISNKAHNSGSEWCGKVHGKYFIYGCLASKDELNRKMSFGYMCSSSNFEECLEKDLKVVNQGIDDATRKTIQSYKRHRFLIRIACIAIPIVIVILVYSLFNN